ncbi:MAG TPA: AraC family transcriptional regulator [Thermoanaerobaculia bacterium]|nr:AraC family transcriptional regulator [Thermoanaerobaculia bacterium]
MIWCSSLGERQEFTEFAIARMKVPSSQSPPHLHVSASVVLVYRGVWCDVASQESLERRIEAGHLLFRPAATHHWNRVEDTAEIIAIELALSLVQAYCPLYGNVARTIELPFEAVDGVPERLRDAVNSGDPVRHMLIDGLVRQMLALGARATEGSSPAWLRRVLQHIDEHLSDALTLEELGVAAEVSLSRLTHGFRAAIGVSPGAYIRERRVRFAARQLRKTDLPIRDIALAAGFCDQAHLTRSFKALRGMTPAEYRRQAVQTVH